MAVLASRRAMRKRVNEQVSKGGKADSHLIWISHHTSAEYQFVAPSGNRTSHEAQENSFLCRHRRRDRRPVSGDAVDGEEVAQRQHDPVLKTTE